MSRLIPESDCAESLREQFNRLQREARDLARDRSCRCHGCSRPMSFWPTESESVQRAPGREYAFRCHACLLAPEMIDAVIHKRPPNLDWVIEVRMRQAESLVQQFDELGTLPQTPEVGRARDLLCCMMQIVADEVGQLTQHRADAALVNELLLTGHAAHPGVPFRGLHWHAARA